MPTITVKLPEDVLDAAARQRLVDGLNLAAAEAERIPAEPARRFLCWVLVEELKAGAISCGGQPPGELLPVLVSVALPAGVLDASSRARYAAGIQQAVAAALPGASRRPAVSTLFHEVPDGHWAVNGEIWQLPQFAARAGYAHLQHLVPGA